MLSKKISEIIIKGILFLALSSFTMISNAPENDRFLEVLNNAEKNTVKKELFAFYHGGIERSVSVEFSSDSVLALAKSFMGTPHKMGGTSKAGIDCSGFVMQVYKHFGIELPHCCQDQARYGTIVPYPNDLQPGDLVFFYNSYRSPNFITHTGIYIGDGEFIHASYSNGVTVSKIDDPYYWGEKYLFGTSLQKPAQEDSEDK